MDGNYGQNQNWQDQSQNQQNQYWQNQQNQYWQNQGQNQQGQYWQNQGQNQQNQNWQNPNQNAYYNGYNNYAPNGYNGPIAVANAAPPKSGGLAIGSLVCGIITVICFWSVVTIIAAIAGIVLGGVNNAQDNPNKGMAAAGIILNVLSIFLTIAFIFILAEL